jgi:hypothetical protein
MSKVSDEIYAAQDVYRETHTAYVSLADSLRVVIRADGTGSRRQRASQVAALKRAIEKRHGCKLTHDHVNYSETVGFLSRTEVWYRLGGTK